MLFKSNKPFGCFQHNTTLKYLSCYDNELYNLDVSANPALTYLKCSSNQLNSLDVRNRNDTNFSLNAGFNRNLKCIYVDDKTKIPRDWVKDNKANYVNNEKECEEILKDN